MKYLFAFLCPPIIAFIYGGCGGFIVNCILCLFGYLPGAIHALVLIIISNQNRRQEELIMMMEAQRMNAQRNNLHPRQRETEPTIIPAMNGDIIDIEREK